MGSREIISGFGRSASKVVRSGVDTEIPPRENHGTGCVAGLIAGFCNRRGSLNSRTG